MCMPTEAKEGDVTPGIGVTDGWESPGGPLEEQSALNRVTSQPPLFSVGKF